MRIAAEGTGVAEGVETRNGARPYQADHAVSVSSRAYTRLRSFA